MSFDILEVAGVLRAAALAEVLPRFRRLAAGDIRIKSEPSDLVTEGDEASERFIRRELAAVLPTARFIGEESVAADPALLDAVLDAELAVLVDPIDGTANFVAGVPLFGVMATITRRGESVAGILYDPFADDFVLAEKGSGAFAVRQDGVRLRLKVADPVPLDQMVGFASTGFLPVAIKPKILTNLAKVRMFSNYRCAAHEYRAFASGHAQFQMYSKLNPWDHMAGALIAEEAGAHVACFDGTRYDATKREGGLLLATSRESWETLMREVFGV
jgi:fructose-1,6-bisphosphatase/inositol monophosphatase family enzyme